MSTRTEQRKSAFKKAIDSDEARMKRRESDSSIRKSKKEESLLKRRREGLPEPVEAVVPEVISEGEGSLESYVIAINSNIDEHMKTGALRIRKLLSVEKSPPIEEVINAGAVPRLIQLLSHPVKEIQFESAWALTNIASGTSEQTKLVAKSGAVPAFIKLLQSPDNDVKDQAVWALGNIAGDGTECRNYLLECNIIPSLLSVFTDNAPFSLLRNATWTLSNLCRGKPAPNFEFVCSSIPYVMNLLGSTDQDIIVDACWTASYLTDGPNNKIQAVIDAGLAPVLVKLMSHSSAKVHIPALRAVGNIVTGDETQTQHVLGCNPLPTFANLMNSSNKSVRKETCWAISNITAGSDAQIQAVFNANLVPGLIALMEKGDFDVRREAAWAIGNAISGGSSLQIHHLVQQGCIKVLCDLLITSDAKLTMLVISSLETILRTGHSVSKQGDTTNKYADFIDEADGVTKIDELQEHENVDIYKKALSIIETYYSSEEDDENNVPNHSDGNQKITNYMFTAASPQQPTGNNMFSF